MPDAIMYQEDTFVVLMPGMAEEFLTPEELLERLTGLLGDRAASPEENRAASPEENRAASPEENRAASPEENRAASPEENRQLDLPHDLQRFATVAEQAQHLRDTACELELAPGETMQWFVVRLEK